MAGERAECSLTEGHWYRTDVKYRTDYIVCVLMIIIIVVYYIHSTRKTCTVDVYVTSWEHLAIIIIIMHMLYSGYGHRHRPGMHRTRSQGYVTSRNRAVHYPSSPSSAHGRGEGRVFPDGGTLV